MTRLMRLGAAVGAALVVAYLVLCAWAADRYTRVVRQPVTEPPTRIGAASEAVALRASGDVTLRGWWFPSRNGRALVLVHGKDMNRAEATLLDIARALHADGYGVLAFDLRGHGESDGDRFSLGQHERHDVAAAIDHAAARGVPLERIAVFGLSMGAATAIQSAKLRRVGAIVADSAYANGPRIVDEAAPSTTGLPPIFTPGITIVARTVLGLDADAVDPDRVVRDHDVPFLFIHCDGDGLIRVRHAYELHAARSGNELWVVPGCEHAAAFRAGPDDYLARVRSFLDAHLH